MSDFDINFAEESSFLTKKDLMLIVEDSKFWKVLRWIINYLFIAGVIILVLILMIFGALSGCFRDHETKCNHNSAYWLNPFAYADSDGDGVGDFQGILNHIDHIEKNIGVSCIIFTTMLEGHYDEKNKYLNQITSFTKIDKRLGDIDKFLKAIAIRGLYSVISLNFNAVSVNHPLVKNKENLAVKTKGKFSRMDTSPVINGSYHSIYGDGSGLVDLNLNAKEVKNEIKKALKYWAKKPIMGILFEDTGFLFEYPKLSSSNEQTSYFNYSSMEFFCTKDNNITLREWEYFMNGETFMYQDKYMFVDLGNIGFQIPRNSFPTKVECMDNYLVSGKTFLVNKYFTKFHGGREKYISTNMDKLSEFFNDPNSDSWVNGLANPSDFYDNDLTLYVIIFSMPGIPVIYYNSELFIDLNTEFTVNEKFYPGKCKPLITNKKFDNTISNYLPMAWTEDQKVALGMKRSVEANIALNSRFSIVPMLNQLVRIRKENPVLVVGKFIPIHDMGMNPETGRAKIVVYQRVLQNTVAVVFVLNHYESEYYVASFGKYCHSGKILFAYPPQQGLLEGTPLKSTTVYLRKFDYSALIVLCTKN